jgi:hypothetical protein
MQPCLIIEESLFICIPLSLPGNNPTMKFPRQRRIVGDVVFCAVHDMSRKVDEYPLHRNSCLISDFEEDANDLTAFVSVLNCANFYSIHNFVIFYFAFSFETRCSYSFFILYELNNFYILVILSGKPTLCNIRVWNSEHFFS